MPCHSGQARMGKNVYINLIHTLLDEESRSNPKGISLLLFKAVCVYFPATSTLSYIFVAWSNGWKYLDFLDQRNTPLCCVEVWNDLINSVSNKGHDPINICHSHYLNFLVLEYSSSCRGLLVGPLAQYKYSLWMI